jgi:acyl-coenzyme A thioesterase PaaI-like protein
MIHGGTLLGFADVSLFAALQLALGVDPVTSLTIDLQCQFLAGGIPSESIDSVVEVLRETRRMAFLRGTMVQGDHRVAAFSATVRK